MNKKIILIMAVICISIFICGCGNQQPSKVDDSKATSENVNDVVGANNNFAFELFSKYKSDEGNIFFSPYSISTALAMTYEGARGKTAEEMKNVFHFPDDELSRRSAYARLYNEINKKDKGYKLSTANALWGQKDFSFLKSYTDTIGNYYGGKIQNLDFKTETEKSRQTINNWVEGQTNNKIKDLIPKGILNPLTRLVLTNAIYFKGTWVKQFDKGKTKDEDFRTKSGTVKAPMMRLTGNEAKFNYSENDKLQILEMPYEGEELSMLIILPKDDTANFDLTLEALNQLKGMLVEQRVNVYIPKFKFDTKYFMSKTLGEMGMPTAFSDEADFSGITLEEPLHISAVIHQAFVEVNEEGTEAAAATGVVLAAKSAMPSQVPEFRADHPFIFIIQQKETGNILFMGRVADPTK